jgi:hypothetical protein
MFGCLAGLNNRQKVNDATLIGGRPKLWAKQQGHFHEAVCGEGKACVRRHDTWCGFCGGDIASCDDLADAQATADLLDKISGTVFAVGDLVYPEGADE